MARTNPGVSTSSVRAASGSSPPAQTQIQADTSATTCLHGRRRDKRTDRGPLVGALVQSTTFVQRHVGDNDGPSYSRVSNPTVDEVEEVLGALEDAPPAVCFGTGLAAETALFLSLLRAGDHAVVGDAIYGGTVRLFRQVLSELGITATFVDSSDASAVTPRHHDPHQARLHRDPGQPHAQADRHRRHRQGLQGRGRAPRR